MTDVLQTGNTNRRDHTQDGIQRWISPILIAIVSYFAKSKLEEIGSKLDQIGTVLPVLQHRVLILEQQVLDINKELERQRSLNSSSRPDRTYFIKPGDLEDSRKQ